MEIMGYNLFTRSFNEITCAKIFIFKFRSSQPFVEKVSLITINQQIKADTFTDVGDPNEPIHKIIQERKVNLLVMSDQQNQSLKK